MCRSIKTLYHVEPPVADDEIAAAALQFVRKISGFRKPSKTNEAAFLAAVAAVTSASRDLLDSLQTDSPPRQRVTMGHSPT